MGIGPMTPSNRQEIEAVIATPGYEKMFRCPADDPPMPHPTLFDGNLGDIVPEPISYTFNDSTIGLYSGLDALHVMRLSDVHRPAEVALTLDINSQQPTPAWTVGIAKDRTLWDVRELHFNPPSHNPDG